MGLRDRLFASTYDRMMAGTEKAGLADIRRTVLAAAAGDVLEIGAGTGHNLAHYGPAVRALTLTEPEPSMLRRLQRTAAHARHPTTVLRAPAENLPFDDGTFDTVVSTLVLCGVEDQPLAVREIRRVLRPDGRLLVVEHVRSDDQRLARKQDRINWLGRLVTRCDCNRPTRRTLQRGGFATDGLLADELPKSPAFVRPLLVGAAIPADIHARPS